MDPLTQLLLQRQMAQGQQPQAPPQAPMPVTPPASGGKTNTPPELTRFVNSQKIQDAYRNGWSPNPVLLQASLKG